MDNENKIVEEFRIYEDVGMVIRYANGITKIKLSIPVCVKCHTTHDIDYSVGLDNIQLPQSHPIFKDNLEMLEWENERKEKSAE